MATAPEKAVEPKTQGMRSNCLQLTKFSFFVSIEVKDDEEEMPALEGQGK